MSEQETQSPEQFHLHVCMPAYDDIKAATVKSLLDLRQHVPFTFDMVGSAEVAISRTLLVERTPKEADYILWVDSDMIFVPQHFHRMAQILIENPGIGMLSATAVRRDGSNSYVINWKTGRNKFMTPEEVYAKATQHIAEQEVVPVDVTGLAFTLMKREIFDQLKKPWFRPQWKKTQFYGEDTFLIQSIKKLGYTPSVDFGSHVGHIGEKVYVPVVPKEVMEKINAEHTRRQEQERAENEGAD
jgi:hypothetical protein